MAHIYLQWRQNLMCQAIVIAKDLYHKMFSATCIFDLEFMYVLSGWEGSAHDSKILSDALTRSTCKLEVPEGMGDKFFSSYY